MAEVTTIEWTSEYLKEPVLWKRELTYVIPGATFNPWWGCMKVSPACKHCYAETFANRFSPGLWGPNSQRRKFDDKHWNEPVKWNEQCKKLGIKRKVFCGSMCDWAEDHNDVVYERERLFRLIEATPHLTWLLLTKRPENILRFIPERWTIIPPQNVWYGATLESDQYLQRVKDLINVPAVVRFLSCEPLQSTLTIMEYLGPRMTTRTPVCKDGSCKVEEGRTYTKFSDLYGHDGKIHWIICGGESGKDATPLDVNHVINLLGHCIQKKVPFLFKQWGEWMPVHQDRYKNAEYKRVGKKMAGRLLLGREYNEMPN